MSSFPSIRIEGGLLGPELLDQVMAAAVPGQKPADFGLEPKRNLTDEIAAVFADSRALWGVFQNRLSRLPDDDLATTVTRDAWTIPFFGLLGYELRYNQRALEVDGVTFAVSHGAGFPRRDTGRGDTELRKRASLSGSSDLPPIHVVGARQELGRLPPSGRPRLAPHSLVQEYLNRSEHVWGIVTNGLILRLLHDSTLVRRQAYVEFDLKAILEEQRFHDFAALFRLLHRTRLPRAGADANECLLEKYHAQAIEQGGRVREHLRDGVEQCLKLLGNAFLAHPANDALRQKLASKNLSTGGFYRQLLRLIYRFLFLLVSEDRGLISPSPVYRDHYGIARLRRMLDVQAAWTDHSDLWLGLRTLFHVLQDEKLAKLLEVAPLNGELFAEQTLDACTLTNRDLLSAFWYLAYYQERRGTPPRRVNYAALDVEELGSVYESLLEFHPDISEEGSGERGAVRLHFDLITGSERKTTGSYYTPPELVNELIESALVPVIEQRLAQARAADDKPGKTPKAPPSPPAAGGEGRGEVGHATVAEKSLLSLRILDPACGSGHMLLAAARRVGKELAKLRTGEDEPAPERVRESVRDVISHCIYGVDKNPLAVDLCRVALWLESHTAGKPLSFLDHRIRCGDSLVGVFDLATVRQGIPDKAFDACQGDDKPTARAAAKVNREEKLGFQDLFAQRDSSDTVMIARHSRDMDAIPDDSPDLIRRKKELFEQAHRDPAWLQRKQACDLWTAAFFQSFQPDLPIITSAPLADLLDGRPIDNRLLARATVESARLRFFHWPLEFPETCSPRPSDGRGAGGEGIGFDVILSNPPWERIKLQEQEFFAARDPQIATAPNKAARKRLIDALPNTNPTLHAEFTAAVHDADALSKFLRQSDRYPLTATGDINTYAVFAETISHQLNPTGHAGMILPLGIVTDDTTKQFFGLLVSKLQLVSVVGFENEEHIFPAVDHRFKFCLFCIAGEKWGISNLRLTFFTRHYNQLRDERRQFTLAPGDFAVLNPNTRTCPVFRTRPDAELARTIHQKIPVLIREGMTDSDQWGVQFMTMFHMSNDSQLFLHGPRNGLLPLYEAKMLWQFDHRFTTYDGATQEQLNVGILPQPTPQQKTDPAFCVIPRYWVDEGHVLNTLARPTQEELEGLASGSLKAAELLHRQREHAPKWLLAFRDITNATNERTSIFTLLPRTGVGNSAPVMLLGVRDAMVQLCLLGNVNALAFDFCARQKIGGTHMNFFILQQLPVFPPSFYGATDVAYVASRVLELVYTADDMQPLAEAVFSQLGTDGWNTWFPHHSVTPQSPLPPPFIWNEARRAHLRAELDAWFARAYGLNRKQLRYILDPADLTPRELENILDPWEEIADPLNPAGYAARATASDFPGETFRVLKEKEQAKYGEYRTRRLVLEAWNRLPQL